MFRYIPGSSALLKKAPSITQDLRGMRFANMISHHKHSEKLLFCCCSTVDFRAEPQLKAMDERRSGLANVDVANKNKKQLKPICLELSVARTTAAAVEKYAGSSTPSVKYQKAAWLTCATSHSTCQGNSVISQASE